jgi:hemerythrin
MAMGILIEWNEELWIGIREIDDQHKILVDLINELHQAMLARRTNEALHGIIERLVNYTETHFGNEERYFASFGYADTAAHVQAHRGFVTKIRNFKTDLASGKLLLSMEVMTFLKEWLIQHILGTDRKYVALFKERGIV